MAVDSPWDDRNPALGQMPDGTLVLAYGEAHSYRADGTFDLAAGPYLPFVVTSTDGGKTWSSKRPLTAPWPNASPYGKITVCKDGTALLSIYQMPSNGTGVLRSRDNGKTWGDYSPVPGHDETQVLETPDGRLMAFSRMDGDTKNGLLLSESDDHGRTWVRERKLMKAQQWPFDATVLASGRLLLSYGSRVDHLGAGVVLSDDGGKTWDVDRRVLVGWNSLRGDTGYPSTVQLDDGTIVTMYYAVGTADSPDTQAIVIRYTEKQLDETVNPVKTSPDVVVYRGTYPAWPWITKTPSGKILCAWREGTEHMFSAAGRVMLAESDDEGKTWSAARTIVDVPDVDDRNAAILAVSDAEWIVVYNTYTSNTVSRAMATRTTDGGRTWSVPEEVSSLDARTRSGPIKLSSGALLLPYYESGGSPQSLAGLSTDGGKTWTTVRVPNAPGLTGDEWSAVEMPDGAVVGIIRNNATGDDGSLYVTQSADQGQTWSVPEKTNLRDEQPATTGSPAQIFLHKGKPWVLYDDKRMISVALATTDDPKLIAWNVDQRQRAYRYRADDKMIEDGGYPCSVPLSGDRRLIVDYVIDGDVHAIVGHDVSIPPCSTAAPGCEKPRPRPNIHGILYNEDDDHRFTLDPAGTIKPERFDQMVDELANSEVTVMLIAAPRER